MREEEIWKAFAETGEPVYYLLYRAMEAEREKELPPLSAPVLRH